MNRLYAQYPEVRDRLEQLGLSRELLSDAVATGLAAWFSCSPNHPPAFPGTFAWAETVRSLRESLLPRGWDRVNDRNLPLTANASTGIAITASSGDECTGIPELSPRTRNPKGSATKDLADANAIQLGLFAEMIAPAEEVVAEAAKWQTWLLLSYRDRVKRVVRCELSRPINIGADGRVDDWDERILLSEIPFDNDQMTVSNNGGPNLDGSLGSGNQSEELNIPVKRRA